MTLHAIDLFEVSLLSLATLSVLLGLDIVNLPTISDRNAHHWLISLIKSFFNSGSCSQADIFHHLIAAIPSLEVLILELGHVILNQWVEHVFDHVSALSAERKTGLLQLSQVFIFYLYLWLVLNRRNLVKSRRYVP